MQNCHYFHFEFVKVYQVRNMENIAILLYLTVLALNKNREGIERNERVSKFDVRHIYKNNVKRNLKIY